MIQGRGSPDLCDWNDDMPRFFVNEPVEDFFEISGDDAAHIAKSLRMQKGEVLTLCHDATDYICKITDFGEGSVKLRLLKVEKCDSEPDVEVRLFQALPKGDKMDFIVQKAVEVGVSAIVPVLTSRCVSRPDAKSLQKKVQRWQKIAQEAAKQSGRGKIPRVLEVVSFENAVETAKRSEKTLLFYENGGVQLRETINSDKPQSIAVFIGPEGGFEPAEVDLVSAAGGATCTLGKRILRTETAAIVATALVIYEVEARN